MTTMWDTTFNDPLWINGFDIGPNGVNSGARFDTDVCDGWYSTQGLDTSQAGQYDLKANSIFWSPFSGTGKTLTVSGTIRAATRQAMDAAFSALVLAVPENSVVPLRRITPTADQTMYVRLAGQIAITENMGHGCRFTIPLVADDILKYGTAQLTDSITSLPPGLYGRTYPRKYPMKYNVSLPTQFVRTRQNYVWNPTPTLNLTGYTDFDTSGAGWTGPTAVNTSSVVDNIPSGTAFARLVVASGHSNIDGGLIYTMAPGTPASGTTTQTCDSDFWTPGRTYMLTAYVRGNTVASSPGLNGQTMQVAALSEPFQFGSQTLLGQSTPVLTTSFQRVSVPFTVPPGANYGFFVFYVNGSVNTTNDNIDVLGVMVEQVSAVNPYFDGSSAYNGVWTSSAYASDSYLQTSVPIDPSTYKWTTNLHNSGTAVMFPVSTVRGPLPSGWALQNQSSGESLVVNFALPDNNSIAVVDHKNETILATATGSSGGLPVEYAANGDFWGLQPGDNILKLTSSIYSPVASWAIAGNSAWR